MSIDISDTLQLLYLVKNMSEHRYDIRISESCVDPNRLMVERQDPDNFTRFQTWERCAFEIAAYVFKLIVLLQSHLLLCEHVFCDVSVTLYKVSVTLSLKLQK